MQGTPYIEAKPISRTSNRMAHGWPTWANYEVTSMKQFPSWKIRAWTRHVLVGSSGPQTWIGIGPVFGGASGSFPWTT